MFLNLGSSITSQVANITNNLYRIEWPFFTVFKLSGPSILNYLIRNFIKLSEGAGELLWISKTIKLMKIMKLKL